MRRGKEKCIPLLFFFFFQRVKEEFWLSYRLCAHGTVSGWADPQNCRLLRQGHLSEPLEFKGKNLIFKETKAGRQACLARKAPAPSPLRPADLFPSASTYRLGPTWPLHSYLGLEPIFRTVRGQPEGEGKGHPSLLPHTSQPPSRPPSNLGEATEMKEWCQIRGGNQSGGVVC